ncbi:MULTISPECIES: hypothetical protein [unclassified Microbacterium]|uniref:hypothetical protein n=1 Tax=unclassified Microbacterium TaxID=2609290 RepID=UPI0030165460
MSLKITTPDGLSGSRSGLDFIDGEAVVESIDDAARAVLTEHGFTFEEIEEAEVVEIEAPTDDWTHEQIDAFAAKFEIDLAGASKKDEKLAVIAKAIEDRTAAAEASGVLQ